MIVDTYKKDDYGIFVFHDDINENHVDYNAQGLDNLFKEEERHFWFISRKEFILQEMNNIIENSSKIIDIGAGTGNVSRFLKQAGYLNIVVGEMHNSGLRYAKSYGIEECYQFDLLRTPFRDEFDGVCMFDVLEHIEDDGLALKNVYDMLKIDGRIILTVPAHKWLWNRDDTVAGHKRRYIKKELELILQNAGFNIEVSKYFFISIVPLLWLRRLINRDMKNEVVSEEYENHISINPIVNEILLFINRIENRINKFIPNKFGGSILMIAKKT